MNVAGVGGAGAQPQAANKSQSGQNVPVTYSGTELAAKRSINDAVAEFKDYMKMTPAQRMQYAWLKAHGISKADFDAMSPAEKQKLMDKMKQEIEQKIKQQTEDKAKSQGNTDIFV